MYRWTVFYFLAYFYCNLSKTLDDPELSCKTECKVLEQCVDPILKVYFELHNCPKGTMAESSDSLLLSKKASKLNKGSDGLPGTLLITESKLKWQPDDRGAAKPVVIEIASITSKHK